MESVWPFVWFALIPAASSAVFWWAARRPGLAVKLGSGFIVGAGLLTLFASIPLKTIDVSGLWEFVVAGILPSVTILLAIFA